jgi:glycosyltransferase involved in cell wall biosynthesis
MRLVLIGPVYPFRGGIAHYTTMLYRAVRERGHDVLLVSFKRQYPQWLFPGRSDRDPSKQPLKVEDVQYWIDSLNPLTWLATFWRVQRYRPDVLILQWWTTFLAPVWLVLGMLNCIFLRKPLVYICHNVLPHEERRWDPWVARAILRWGRQFIVQSAQEEKRLLGLMPRARVVAIPHPVYDMFADGKISQKEARERLGLPLNVPILLFFGIVREYKGLKDLLMALPRIREQLGRVIVLVTGEFWEDKQSYLEMIERLGIGDSVIIEDRYVLNEEVGLYFSATDALVAPYRQATGSGAVQMARGFGVPVIGTAGRGSERITAGETAGLSADGGPLAAEIVRFFAKETLPRAIHTDAGQVSSWGRLVDQIVGRGV